MFDIFLWYSKNKFIIKIKKKQIIHILIIVLTVGFLNRKINNYIFIKFRLTKEMLKPFKLKLCCYFILRSKAKCEKIIFISGS